jgi:hypothetical protein
MVSFFSSFTIFGAVACRQMCPFLRKILLILRRFETKFPLIIYFFVSGFSSEIARDGTINEFLGLRLFIFGLASML